MKAEGTLFHLDKFRKVHPGGRGETPPGASFGWFEFPDGMRVMSSGNRSVGDWEHVSVSFVNRVPTWDEMKRVKELFWRPDETVIQFHPKASKYKNEFPFCLHLWSVAGVDIPLPPSELV